MTTEIGMFRNSLNWTAFLLDWLKLHCCWRCCIVKIHITCIVSSTFHWN